ncbi:hypothetical protein GCM10020256_42200 [Streptomyces thermocoprophilus]
MTSSVVNGGISFWYADDGLPAVREPLPGDATADVVIVGGGYTGLWTAYYLKKAAPFLRITVLEQKFCGYGASGRNGGWLYNGVAGRDRYAKLYGHEAAVRLQKAMNETVAEVVRVADDEGIDADIVRGGVLEVARTPAQLARLRAFHEHELSYGETDRELYGARETAERIRVADAVGSAWTPHGARLHPVKLVKGLAAAVEKLGVTIFESTPVTEVRAGRAVTPYGTVRASYVLRCTEGFTASLKGQRRTWLPMNSSMVATEPLSEEQWAAIGWEGRETLGGTWRTRTCTRSAPRTGGSRWAGAGCRTGSVRGRTTTGVRSRRRWRHCGTSWWTSSLRWRGCGSRTRGRVCWGGAAGLVCVGDAGPGDGAGLGRRVCRVGGWRRRIWRGGRCAIWCSWTRGRAAPRS